jgi:DNA-directed RNA polymerase subunit H
MLQTSINNITKVFRARGYQNIRTAPSVQCGQYQVYSLLATNTQARGKLDVQVFWVTCDEQPVTLYKSMFVYLLGHGQIISGSHLVFITKSISNSCLVCIQTHCSYHEIISYEETLYFILSHNYVPEYQLLSEAEIVDVEQKYGNRNQFPKLLYQIDAVARIMDFRPGDIVRIFRKSPTNGMSTFYRQVISS